MSSTTKAALEQAEAEKRRRVNERIEKGEALRLPLVVVGRPCRAETEKQRRIAALRADGETREIVFDEAPTGPAPIGVIVTGVPRPARDGESPCENCTCSKPESAYPGAAARRELERKHEPAPAPMPRPSPELPLPTEWWPFRVQIRAGDGAGDPGQIIEGRYGVVNDLVYVEDDQGKAVGTQRLRPGDNPAGVAQKILREKWRGKSSFYDGPINRPIKTYH